MKYSIIIPIYNAEATLKRCLNSVVTALIGWESISEIILVNDGSTDSSAEICEGFYKQCPFIQYITQENKGVSESRNLGLSIAKGDYILFVDSDDELSMQAIRIVNDAIETYHADYYIFSYLKKKGSTTKEIRFSRYYSSNKNHYNKKIRNYISQKKMHSPCAKVYKRSIIISHDVFFPPGISIAEDYYFNMVYSMWIKSICVSNELVYTVYLDNADSLSRRPEQKKGPYLSKNMLLNKLYASQLTEIEKKRYLQGFLFQDYRRIYTLAKRMKRSGILQKDRIRYLREEIQKLLENGMLFPFSLFSFFLILPIWFRQAWLIDLIMRKIYRE